MYAYEILEHCIPYPVSKIIIWLSKNEDIEGRKAI